MDLILDSRDTAAAKTATARLDEYLAAHAADRSSVGAAVDAASGFLRESLDHAGGRAVWLSVDWAAPQPTLVLRPLRDSTPLQEAGLRLGAPVERLHRPLLEQLTEDSRPDSVTLPVARYIPRGFDPDPASLGDLQVDPLRDGPASVAVALMAAMEAHPTASAEQVAMLAGAVLADAAVHELPSSPQEVATIFIDVQNALGTRSEAVAVAEDKIDFSLQGTPLGMADVGVHSLEHISTGMAGRLAARVSGAATVTLQTGSEDHADRRLRVWLRPPQQQVVGEAFHWPPRGGAQIDGTVPQMDLTVTLPRESGSVPVVRRLAAQALRSFGVTPEDIDDVQLAITEACANVIDHAADTDTYEVTIELAADRCGITVLDRGAGFDSTLVPVEADDHAEEGRGLAIMRALVDKIAFEEQPQSGAVVHMVKSLNYDRDHPLRRALGLPGSGR